MTSTNAQTDQECWQSVPRDPDPEDLGYEFDNWEVIRTREDDRGHLMFLPENEDMLRKEAFIVADACSVCDVVDRI